MIKRLIPIFFLIAFLIPQHHTLANERNMYYNEEYKYSISFPDSWYIFSEDMKKTLPPEERESSPAIFGRENGSQMFIRHLSSDKKNYKLYKSVIEYVQETPKEKQKIRRQLNPIAVEMGRTINEYKIDELNETVELQFSKSSQLGDIYITIFWKEFKGKLIELEFYHFSKDKNLILETSEINQSFTISPEALTSNIKEGSMNDLKTKITSGMGQNNPFIDKVIEIITTPIVWITTLSIIFVMLLMSLIYRLI
ncbi:hypothetical protein MZM54_04710 [[Brevibacterium] frigoritolerans]|nr:hypothetical protein [Peribacillus frigoritolerans]